MPRPATSFFLLLLLLPAAAGAQPRPAPRPTGPESAFTVVNRSPVAIRELFVTSAGNANWGQNRLDGRNGNPTSIPSAGSFTVRRRADNNCIFDIRVVFADNRSEERRGANICSVEQVVIGEAAASAVDPATGKPGDDPSVRLFNRAARPLVELFATPSGLANWGQNRLGADPLPPDHDRMLTLPRDGNCIYDLKAVFADKRTLEKHRANLCRIAQLAIP